MWRAMKVERGASEDKESMIIDFEEIEKPIKARLAELEGRNFDI